MLRVSAQKTGQEADLTLINGTEGAAAGDIAFAHELAGFAEALAGRDEAALAVSYTHLTLPTTHDV